MDYREDIDAINIVSWFVPPRRLLVVPRRLNTDYWLVDQICRCLALHRQVIALGKVC